MPDPATARLALYKSKSDGSEIVSYTQDIGQNWDKVDLAVGFQACTSSTRPAAPFSGKPIMETNTGRTYFSNGTVPASGSWVEIPNSSGTYASTLNVSGTVNLTGALNLTGVSALVERATVTDNAYRARITGDSNSRLLINADGKIVIGDGATAGDTNIYRAAANILATDDDFAINVAGKGLKVKEGTNAKMGRATLVAGTVVVSTTAVTSTSEIFLTCQSAGGTPGFLRVSARTGGTSFTILSSSGTDTSVVGWLIVEPA